jgi:hypothetical protein
MVSALDNISRARARKSIASVRSLISAIAKLAVFARKTCTLGLALTGATTPEPGSGLSGQMPPRPACCRRGRASGASYAPVDFCGLGGTKRRGGARRRAPQRCDRPVHARGRQLGNFRRRSWREGPHPRGTADRRPWFGQIRLAAVRQSACSFKTMCRRRLTRGKSRCASSAR